MHAQVIALDTTMTTAYSWTNTVFSTTSSYTDTVRADYIQTGSKKAEETIGEMRGLLRHPDQAICYVSIFVSMHTP